MVVALAIEVLAKTVVVVKVMVPLENCMDGVPVIEVAPV